LHANGPGRDLGWASYRMIRKSGYRFSDRIMRKIGESMIRKSGYRFSGKVMLGPPDLQGTL
jgi:hypothetical protein